MTLGNSILIVLNLIMVVLIIVSVIFVVSTNGQLKECQDNQSDYCYTIQCPGETVASVPCKGYASRPGPVTNGNPTFYCSYAPSTLVDANGNAIL